MKWIYLTDPHITGVGPGRRKDIYYIAILKKLWELTPVIKTEKIDFVVIGGDLFDIPKVSNKLYGQVARLLRGWGVKIFVVPGNHDLYGQNIDTLEHTSLGALASAGVITLMTRAKSPFYFQKKNDPNCPLLAFTGQEYYDGIDTKINNDYEPEPSSAQFNIVVAHGMLVERPFHPGIPHTVIADVTTTADLVLSGHYHPKRFDYTHGTTRFIKPVGTARLEATQYNIDNKPEYAIIEATKSGFTSTFHTYTTAAEGVDIFDRTTLVEEKEHKTSLQSFQKTMGDIDVKDANSINDILNKVSKALGSNSNHTASAIARLTQAQLSSSNKTLNGYMPSKIPLQIVEVTLINFQGHKNTVVNFDMNALNALIGESDNGKTSILRCIKWVLYNDPKGSEFIKRGETFCEGTIVFSNGTRITRSRTVASAGKYEIYDGVTGKTESYAGFSHNVPMEVYNAHQMPKIEVGKEELSLNIAEQLDGPFMLSQSAGDRAALIGKITGVQVVDEAIKLASGEIINMQRGAKTLDKDIEQDENKLTMFTDLDVKLDAIKMGEYILEEIAKADKELTQLQHLQQDINTFNHYLETETLHYAQFGCLDDVSNLVDKIDLEQEKYLSNLLLRQNYFMSEQGIVAEQKILKALPDFDKLKAYRDEIYTESVNLRELDMIAYENNVSTKQIEIESDILSKMSGVNAVTILTLESALDEYNQLKEIYAGLNIFEENIIRTKKEVDTNISNMSLATAQYRTLLSEMGTCPICKSSLSHDIACTMEL